MTLREVQDFLDATGCALRVQRSVAGWSAALIQPSPGKEHRFEAIGGDVNDAIVRVIIEFRLS